MSKKINLNKENLKTVFLSFGVFAIFYLIALVANYIYVSVSSQFLLTTFSVDEFKSAANNPLPLPYVYSFFSTVVTVLTFLPAIIAGAVLFLKSKSKSIFFAFSLASLIIFINLLFLSYVYMRTAVFTNSFYKQNVAAYEQYRSERTSTFIKQVEFLPILLVKYVLLIELGVFSTAFLKSQTYRKLT